MKHILKKGIIFLLLATMLCSCVIGCAKDPDPTPGEDSQSESGSGTVADSTPSTEPVESETVAPDTEGAPLTYELKNFAVIRPHEELAQTKTKTAATNLYNLLKANGIRVERPVEDVNSDEQELEILVGLTNRAESAKLAEKLTEDDQFLISFQKNKIVLLAKRDLVLDSAVNYFMENYVKNAENGVLSVNENHTYIGKVQLVELANNGVVKYTIISSFSDGEVVASSAMVLANRLKASAGAEEVKTADDFDIFGEDEPLIIIGNVDATKYPEVAGLKADWSFPEYGIKVQGNRIYVLGNFAESVNSAVLMMVDLISRQSAEIDGKLYVVIPENCSEVDDAYLADYPSFTEGTLNECYENPYNELVYRYINVSAASYEGYVKKLKDAGFTSASGEHVIGRNRFTTCVKEGVGQVHVAFYGTSSGTGDMSIFAGKLEKVVAIPQETYDPATQKVTDTTLHVMSLDYSGGAYAVNKRLCDGSGMSFVITLEDGRFVVMDGGYTDNDGKNLAEYLKAVNKRPDGKVIIAAWFISHAHEDHYGGCKAFLTKYAEGIEIEYFVANPPSEDRAGSNWMLSEFPSLMATTGAKLIRPHTGQVLKFCNTEFEIILTHENLSSAGLSDFNNTSTVVRMWENGYSTMFTGDASVASCNKMVSLFGDVLKSDIHQTNHHAVSGGTLDFYKKVNASIALWTTSQDSFAGHDDPNANCGYTDCVGRTGRINGGGNSAGSAEQASCNKWMRDTIGVENCYVADDVIEWITFGDEIVVNTDTGYFVNNQVGTVEGEGLLQVPTEPAV